MGTDTNTAADVTTGLMWPLVPMVLSLLPIKDQVEFVYWDFIFDIF